MRRTWLSCDLANVPPAAADVFKASADRLFNAALERVKELAAAYAGEPAVPAALAARPPRSSGQHSLAARAARSVSDAAAGIACVMIVSEEERGEAERLVGAHCASSATKIRWRPSSWRAGSRSRSSSRAAWRRAISLRGTGGLGGGGDFLRAHPPKGALQRPCRIWATCDACRSVERGRAYTAGGRGDWELKQDRRSSEKRLGRKFSAWLSRHRLTTDCLVAALSDPTDASVGGSGS
jgi:hypothetical protein